jgi:hypothetical protein
MKNETFELAIPFTIFIGFFTFAYIFDPSMGRKLFYTAIIILTVLIIALTLDRFLEKFQQPKI